MEQQCPNCNQSFQIHQKDLEFYQTIKVPPPTHCPTCRQQRRLAIRNERHLFKDKCHLTKQPIISMYSPDKEYIIYSQEAWWSDKWEATEYGQPYNFQKPFFQQFQELQKKVPRISLLNVNAENSKYCNFTGDVKNSYLIFGSVYSEDCYYGSPYYSKDCIDTLVIRECELCYECTDSRKLYKCLHCQDCYNSSNLIFCYDLKGCQECIACSGLRNKEFHIFNKPYSQEEYFNLKEKLDLNNEQTKEKIQATLNKLMQETPRKYMQSNQVENVSGDHIYNSKNTHHSFFADRCENCSYCAQVVDLNNCYDNNYTEENEWCYEYLGSYRNNQTFFSTFCRHSHQVWYSEFCINCKYCFGCSNLKNKSYCILNKQYTPQEYPEILKRITEHMKTTGEWGEFFPISHSIFNYNETVAQEYFPQKNEQLQHSKAYDTTDPKALKCINCEKPFKLIPQEINLYQTITAPTPKSCPDCRHESRLKLRNPRHLWQRECNQCKKQIKSTYSPERKEQVLCEDCYLTYLS